MLLNRLAFAYPYTHWLLLLVAGTYLPSSHASECHYQEWRWNIHEQRAVLHRDIVKDYADLTAEERDAASGCTVCREDQREIRIAGVAPFSLCRHYAPQVESILHQLVAQGERIESVIAYRVGRTRGEVDRNGNRTGFSNHSFGIALDINRAHNGLYDRCPSFGPDCQLRQGGPWRPGNDPFSLNPRGNIVTQLRHIGLRWGGEIRGEQKDFMHFSPSGY